MNWVIVFVVWILFYDELISISISFHYKDISNFKNFLQVQSQKQCLEIVLKIKIMALICCYRFPKLRSLSTMQDV